MLVFGCFFTGEEIKWSIVMPFSLMPLQLQLHSVINKVLLVSYFCFTGLLYQSEVKIQD